MVASSLSGASVVDTTGSDVEPVVQGCSRGPESSVVWFAVRRGVGGRHGFPDPRPTGASPHVGESDADGGRSVVPDLSREGPFDVHQDRPHSGASPRLLDGMQGCQLRMTSYDEEHSGPDFTPAYGVQHWADTIECTGSPAACNGAESNVVKRSAAVSNERYASGDALLPSSPSGPLYDCDGFVAASEILQLRRSGEGPLPLATCNWELGKVDNKHTRFEIYHDISTRVYVNMFVHV